MLDTLVLKDELLVSKTRHQRLPRAQEYVCSWIRMNSGRRRKVRKILRVRHEGGAVMLEWRPIRAWIVFRFTVNGKCRISDRVGAAGMLDQLAGVCLCEDSDNPAIAVAPLVGSGTP